MGRTGTIRLAVHVHSQQHGARLARWHLLCARAGPGGVWATDLCCRRVRRTIHLLKTRLAQEVLGWQLHWQRSILPLLVGDITMALQHRQNQILRCLCCRNLLCDQ